MRLTNSKSLLFVVIVLISFVLSACGEPKAKTNKEILQDIIDTGKLKKYIENSSTADYEIEISNRMTTPENKIDTMDFNVHLVTDFADIHYFGDIEYALYNEGWGKNSIYNTQIIYDALEDIDESEVYAFIDNYDQDDGNYWGNLGSWSTYKIIGKEHHGNDITYEIEFDGERTKKINCFFDPTDGTWEISTYVFTY